MAYRQKKSRGISPQRKAPRPSQIGSLVYFISVYAVAKGRQLPLAHLLLYYSQL